MLPALISAGASVLGGILGKKSADKQAQQQYEHQKEFAQSGIQWKVKDAAKAGIHPLYALGAQTTSYSPTSVGGTDFGIPEAGQNIGRAIDATRSSPEQQAALRLTAAQIDGVNLDNEIKKTQLASALALANQSQTSLPGPFDRRQIPGQGNTPTVSSGIPLEHRHAQPDFTPNIAGGLTGPTGDPRQWAANPNYSNAQAYEDRYGEMSDWIFGPRNLVADFYYNTRAPKSRWLRSLHPLWRQR